MELTIAQRQAVTKKKALSYVRADRLGKSRSGRGRTAHQSVKNKTAKWVYEALEHVTGVPPFPIIGIDSDNGSEFINEQKNSARIRELVRHLR